jgi:hypothetical protein
MKRINITVSNEQYNKLNEIAKLYSIRVGTYCKMTLSHEKLPQLPKNKINEKYFVELNRIGNNINQIARKINANERQDEMTVLLELKEMLLEIL